MHEKYNKYFKFDVWERKLTCTLPSGKEYLIYPYAYTGDEYHKWVEARTNQIDDQLANGWEND